MIWQNLVLFLRGKRCFPEWHALARFTAGGGALSTCAELILVPFFSVISCCGLLWCIAKAAALAQQDCVSEMQKESTQRCFLRPKEWNAFSAARHPLPPHCCACAAADVFSSEISFSFGFLTQISKVCSVFFQAVPSTGKCLIYSCLRPSINLSFISSETAGVLRAVPLMITTLPFRWICFRPSTLILFYPSTPKVQNSESLLGKPLIFSIPMELAYLRHKNLWVQ